MNNPSALAHHAAVGLHRSEADLPFVPYGSGVELQLLQVDIPVGLWVTRVRFRPGVTLERHRHTGDVLAFTLSGSWRYLEYPDVNSAGSYLYEPAGSIHQLQVLSSNAGVTDVWFAIRGANLHLDDGGNIVSIRDAPSILELYRERCRELGRVLPPVIGV
jgi:quercetin dioxygenase-like cupin family protein